MHRLSDSALFILSVFGQPHLCIDEAAVADSENA
ncbi:hypothetical protein SAMN05421686_105267 [Thalassolituus maritimus]|jgi:hypothetical protein|uniref:Uncharacterized protein n=1 Tax=Thalassolituus maritimus TaxID=484498 RepID=A0A1N7ML12_9GAMM|nr:hypothetical protein SAMN05421686_105267 [Thalassolituus maritimus]